MTTSTNTNPCVGCDKRCYEGHNCPDTVAHMVHPDGRCYEDCVVCTGEPSLPLVTDSDGFTIPIGPDVRPESLPDYPYRRNPNRFVAPDIALLWSAVRCVFCGGAFGACIDACPGGHDAVAMALGFHRSPVIVETDLHHDNAHDFTWLYAYHDILNGHDVPVWARWNDDGTPTYGVARGRPDGMLPCRVCGHPLCPFDWCA